MKLYTYWRSQASFRVRIALRLKGLVAETTSLDLLKGDQFEPSYRIAQSGDGCTNSARRRNISSRSFISMSLLE